jgi:hypothetical protein
MVTFNFGMKIMAIAANSYCRITDQSLLTARKDSRRKDIPHFLVFNIERIKKQSS